MKVINPVINVPQINQRGRLTESEKNYYQYGLQLLQSGQGTTKTLIATDGYHQGYYGRTDTAHEQCGQERLLGEYIIGLFRGIEPKILNRLIAVA